jgi:DNA processing protein
MIEPTTAQAAALAATEVIPADWGDLAVILQKFEGPSALLGESPSGTDRASELLRYLQRAIDPSRIEYWLDRLEALAVAMPDVKFVTIDSREYPANLKLAYGSPPFLFIRGRIVDADTLSLAIVGTRKASPDGLKSAANVAITAAQHGITVVSGLARGIDAAGHRGVISAGGRTIAAIATGIDRPLTRESDITLGSVLHKSGSIVSQFRPGSPATSSSFLQRNGVISGLSLVSLAIEAGERSGTRNEIEHALRQDRRVLVWRPSGDVRAWLRIYDEEPLVGAVWTEEEVIDEVLAVARKCADDDLLFLVIPWQIDWMPRSCAHGGRGCLSHVPQLEIPG